MLPLSQRKPLNRLDRLSSAWLEASAASAQTARVTRTRHSKQLRRRCACEAQVETKTRRRKKRRVSFRAPLKVWFCRAEGARAVQCVSVECGVWGVRQEPKVRETRRQIKSNEGELSVWQLRQFARHDGSPCQSAARQEARRKESVVCCVFSV